MGIDHKRLSTRRSTVLEDGEKLIGRGEQLLFDGRQLGHFHGQIFQSLFDARLFQFYYFRRVLPVGGIELRQIARYALFHLRPPSVDIAAREILVAIVHRFEFTAADGDAGFGEQFHLAAQLDEARAEFFDAGAIVLAEVGDGFMVGRKAGEQPHHFDVAASLGLKATA